MNPAEETLSGRPFQWFYFNQSSLSFLSVALSTPRPDAPSTSGSLAGYSGGTALFRTPDCRSSGPLLTLKNALITRLTSCLVPHKLSSEGISTNPALLLNKYKQKGSGDAAPILPENYFLSFHCHFFFHKVKREQLMHVAKF